MGINSLVDEDTNTDTDNDIVDKDLPVTIMYTKFPYKHHSQHGALTITSTSNQQKRYVM